MVADKSPWPTSSGSRVRLAQLWEAFDPTGRRLVVVGSVGTGEEEALKEATSGRCCVVPASQDEIYRQVAAQVEACDVVWASGPSAAQTVNDWERPLIVDVPSLSRRLVKNDVILALRGLPSTLAAKRLIRTMIGAPHMLSTEKSAWCRADVVTPCSPYEQERLPETVRQRSVLVPNGCTLRRPPTIRRSAAAPRLIFVGTLHYQPNFEAALTLVERIVPSVRKLVPKLELDIVGSAPPSAIRRLGVHPGVTVHGYVEDLDRVYEGATHAVIPLSRSTGTNVKVLDAIARGIPVVATPAALRGLPSLVPGRDVLSSASWQQCAAAVVGLINDPQRSLALAVSAWKTVKLGYTWEHSQQILQNLVAQLHEIRT